MKKIFVAYVLVEAGADENHRHVSIKVDPVVGQPVYEEIDLEMDQNDISSMKKIVKQINESKFGDKFEIKVKVKA